MVSEQNKQAIFFGIFGAVTYFSVLLLLFVLVYVVVGGAPVISWDFLTKTWAHNDIAAGGILQAILGTLLLALGVAVVSLPFGFCTAIYLNEYARDNLFTRLIKLAIRNLAGVPSIVYGIFGFALFVLFFNLGTSLLAAALTLGCMTLPWIITASEEALKAVPQSFREGSYALGASKWETIRKNVLPHAMSGMLTGSILGISRAMGETAPIIMVGATFYQSYLSVNVFDKFMALPYHLFILATQHANPDAQTYALGTATVLIVIIFALNFGVIMFRYYLRKKREW